MATQRLEDADDENFVELVQLPAEDGHVYVSNCRVTINGVEYEPGDKITVNIKLDSQLEPMDSELAYMQKLPGNREWLHSRDVLPEEGQKIVCVGSLPTGTPVLMAGHVEGEWFVNACGGSSQRPMPSLWRPATTTESVEYWKESGWVG